MNEVTIKRAVRYTYNLSTGKLTKRELQGEELRNYLENKNQKKEDRDDNTKL